MKTKIGTIWLTDANDVRQSFRLRWDMHAIATFEELTGANALVGIQVNVRNLRAVLWAAIDAAAAAKDEDAPVSFRRFGTLLADEDEIAAAVKEAARLIGVGEAKTKEQKQPGPQVAPTKKRASRSPSRAATSSEPSTSDSATATSGA